MESLNSAFFFVTDKIISLQSFFMDVARSVGYIALLVSVCMAAFNYGITGTGLKENIVKIMKAVIFYAVVLLAYPNIVGWMTNMSFTLARDSTYLPMQGYLRATTTEMQERANMTRRENRKGTYGTMALTEYDNLFSGIIYNRTFTATDENGSMREVSYATVAPAAAFGAVMLIAGECWSFADKQTGFDLAAKFINGLKGLVTAGFVIGVGAITIFNYLIAFIEFMLISSVGIILFPLSLYEGTKFMAEKYITAMIGFFIKLLFCTICIFLMLYGYISLSKTFVENNFTGQIEDIVKIVVPSLLFFYISTSAPGLAQSLLTGAPSLSAGGMVRTITAGVAGAAGAASLISKGAAVAGGAAGAVGGAALAAGKAVTGAVSHAAGAASAASLGAGLHNSSAGKAALGVSAFAQDMGSQAANAVGNKASNLVRSLGARAGAVGQYHSGKFREGENTGRQVAAGNMKNRALGGNR